MGLTTEGAATIAEEKVFLRLLILLRGLKRLCVTFYKFIFSANNLRSGGMVENKFLLLSNGVWRKIEMSTSTFSECVFLGNKKMPRLVRGKLIEQSSLRNNPYCDLLQK